MSDFHRPTTVAEAVSILADEPNAQPVAGGTDLFIDRRLGRADDAAPLVDLSAIDELSGLSWTGDQLTIGATTRIRSIELDQTIIERAPALAEAARVLGSVQIRNMATIGGNICHATPSAEMPPTLLVHDAHATVAGSGGSSEMPLSQLATGPGTTVLEAGQLLTGVRATVPQGSGSCYIRQTIRWSMDLAGVGVAARVIADGDDGVVTGVRLALGAVSPVPMLVPGLDDLLVGSPLSGDLVAKAAALASASCSPISDARGTESYRRHVVGVLSARALDIAYARSTGRWAGGPYAPPNGKDMVKPYESAQGVFA